MADRNETFVTVKDFPNYSISNKGKILSYTKTEDGRLLKPQQDAMGYLHVRLYDGTGDRGYYKNGDPKPKLEKVHRLVAKHFLPEPDKDVYMEVNHRNGNKQDNDVTNLEWMSRKDNVNHAWATGLNEAGRIAGGSKRRKPVKIIFPDGRIEYYEGRVQAGIYLGVTPLTILYKFKSDSWGRAKFKAEPIEELPEGETFVYDKDKELLLREWNAKYFGKTAAWRIKRRKKLEEEK